MKIGVSWLVGVMPKANTKRLSAHEAALQSRKRVFREPLLLFVERAGLPSDRHGTWRVIGAVRKRCAREAAPACGVWDHPHSNDAPD
jgi:hypothetical protein